MRYPFSHQSISESTPPSLDLAAPKEMDRHCQNLLPVQQQLR
jgi:hypothetical protein